MGGKSEPVLNGRPGSRRKGPAAVRRPPSRPRGGRGTQGSGLSGPQRGPQWVLQGVLGVLPRVVGVLHGVLWVLQGVLGVLHGVLGVRFLVWPAPRRTFLALCAIASAYSLLKVEASSGFCPVPGEVTVGHLISMGGVDTGRHRRSEEFFLGAAAASLVPWGPPTPEFWTKFGHF